MDAQEFLILETDVAAQLALIDDVFANLEDRAGDFDADDARQTESVAYQIHNVYNAFEELLRLIAAHFEYQIADASRWHSALLQRMTQPIPGVRPAPLTKETFLLLEVLRGFRYFFRHAYAATVVPDQVQSNLGRARRAHNFLRRDLAAFLGQLKPRCAICAA